MKIQLLISLVVLCVFAEIAKEEGVLVLTD